MRYLYIVLILFLNGILFAQGTNDSLTIDEIFISVERLSSKQESSVKSVQRIEPSYIKLNAASINDHLEEVPGLYISNGFNYAQDARIAIRGFGARSAFGIRGVKIIVDGIPETTPDGQGQLDNVNLAAIDNIEILKSGSSSLYGNASGGVLNINTKKNVLKDYVSASAIFGSNGLGRYDIGLGKAYNNSNLILSANYTDYTGYRQNSELTSYNVNGRWNTTSDNHYIDIIANYTNSPTANDPGGINIGQVETDRRSARDRNISFASGESIDHFKIGVQHTYSVGTENSLKNYAFASTRNFLGRLPFENSGYIDLGRFYYGVGSSYENKSIFESGVNSTILGFDLGVQNDDRDRYNNLSGEKGDLVFSQKEKFLNLGLYVQNRLEINKLNLEGGLRYDMNRLSVDDRNLSNGDNSDQITLNSLNGNLGLAYRLAGSTYLRTQLSTSFETPTLSELSADPNGSEGFNMLLEPMSAVTLEFGVRSSIGDLNIDATVFSIDTDNEILSYELEQFPDRDFFRNAGNSSRVGVELTLDYMIMDQLDVSGSYTYLNARFDDYIQGGNDFSGNDIPGIPQNRFTLSADWKNSDGLNLGVQFLSTGSIFLNDANSVNTESFQLLNFQSSYIIRTTNILITPFINVANLTGEQYFSNIRINAFGSRFYEPAPERQYVAGVSITF